MTLEGCKVLLGLQLGSRESYEDWLDFARDLTARGLRCPTLVVADGAWPLEGGHRSVADGARPALHRAQAQNLLAKLPERLHREVKARYWAALDEASPPTQAKAALQALARDYAAAHPSFTHSLEHDLDYLVVHLRFPYEHRKRTRSTDESVKCPAASPGVESGRARVTPDRRAGRGDGSPAAQVCRLTASEPLPGGGTRASSRSALLPALGQLHVGELGLL